MLNEKVNNLQLFTKVLIIFVAINPFALRKAKIAYNFGLSECNRVKLVGSLVQKNYCCHPGIDVAVSVCIGIQVQLNFSGSNTDGLFTMAVSNSFLSP